MGNCCQVCLCLLTMVLLVSGIPDSQASLENGKEIKSATFLSPKFALGPGQVGNRSYYYIDFPRGHIAVKSFTAEVVDEAGNSVPLHETYVHHWYVIKHHQRMGSEERIVVRNSGTCQGNIQSHYFGLGSESRKTATLIPDPYGVEVGNPDEIPEGYQEKWMLNIHAIDTRGVEDRLGCAECRCDLYNITMDASGQPLRPGYKGGFACCYDHTQCRVRERFEGARRSLFLRYTVKWVDWDSSIKPVKVFILDATDTGKRRKGPIGVGPEDGCQVEYDVEPCNASGVAGDECTDIKRARITMPSGGHVIYGVAIQNPGGIGSTLYGKSGEFRMDV